MKKKNTKVIINNKNFKSGKTDWKRLEKMSEKDIETNALSDDSTIILSDEEVVKFRRVNPVKTIDVKEIRDSLGLSQHKFAIYFGFSTRTIQEWEQGRRQPTGAIRNFLAVISHNPQAVQDALSQSEHDS